MQDTQSKAKSASKMLLDSTSKLMSKSDAWARCHTNAMTFNVDGPGPIIASMVKAWAKYADFHQDRYLSEIGDDGFIGTHWADMGKAILGLLNGETGGLDCGTLDGIIRKIATEHGVNGDEL